MKKNKFLTKCECGCDVFYITEEISYKASVDPKTGILDAYSTQDSEIKSIVCIECDEEYDFDDFEDVHIDL